MFMAKQLKRRKAAKRKATRRKKLTPLPPVGALKARDAASYLGGISMPTLRRLVARDLLRPSRGLRHHVFSLVELDRYLRDTMTT
jgi:helix-turn-helix protein